MAISQYRRFSLGRINAHQLADVGLKDHIFGCSATALSTASGLRNRFRSRVRARHSARQLAETLGGLMCRQVDGGVQREVGQIRNL
jgi:hypothetical protein